MRQWFMYFFGTPRRFLITTGLLGLIIVMTNPGLLRQACERLIHEVQPLFGPVLILAIVWVGFRMMFRGLFNGGRK